MITAGKITYSDFLNFEISHLKSGLRCIFLFALPFPESPSPQLKMLSNDEIYFLYGKNAVISRKGRFTFVHLDRPSAALVCARTENFDPDEFFDRDCWVCEITRDGGIVVFDDSSYDEEEILLE